MDGLTVEGDLMPIKTGFSTTANTPNASLIIGNTATTGSWKLQRCIRFCKR